MMKHIEAVTNADPTMAVPLYKRIHIKDPSEYPQIYQLLESYISNPSSAAVVKEIVFRPHKWGPGYRSRYGPSPEAWKTAEAARNVSNDEIVFQALKVFDLSAEQEQHWAKILTWMKPDVIKQRTPSDGEEDYRTSVNFNNFASKHDNDFIYHATAVLLSLCPNIERFVYIDNELHNPVKKFLRLNNYGLLSHDFLQRLKDVIILSTDDYLFGDERFYVSCDVLELMRMFHRLPSIHSISAEVIDTPRVNYQDTFPASTTTIKKITIAHSALGSDVIGALIRAPRALEEVTITTGGRGSYDGLSALLYAEEVGRALACQKTSLVKIDLDLGHLRTMDSYYGPVNEPNDYDTAQRQDEWDQLASRESTIDAQEAQLPLRSMELPKDREYGWTIGSLRDFERLTHLNVSVQHLLGCSLKGALADVPDSEIDQYSSSEPRAFAVTRLYERQKRIS